MCKSVLLIEDEPGTFREIRHALSRDGWTVTVHSHGPTAALAAEERCPDVIVLDARLPHRSGVDVLTDLRGAEATRGLPVLMLSAGRSEAERQAALRLGADISLRRPFSTAQVLEALRELDPEPLSRRDVMSG